MARRDEVIQDQRLIGGTLEVDDDGEIYQAVITKMECTGSGVLAHVRDWRVRYWDEAGWQGHSSGPPSYLLPDWVWDWFWIRRDRISLPFTGFTLYFAPAR